MGPISCHKGSVLFCPAKSAEAEKSRFLASPTPSNPKNGHFQAVFGVFGLIFRDFSAFFALRRTWMGIFAVLRRLSPQSPHILRILDFQDPYFRAESIPFLFNLL
jgi:hypothetical protein